ncbi:MAG TPA: NUMOD4 domain-containing protein [Bacteroidales bacterium]|nr:NUMOD4 domain-containing protein [Bacteroidales bacterium]
MEREPERWEDVIGYEGRYKISSHGRVKSLKRTVPHSHSGTYTFPEKVLKGRRTTKYLLVALYNKNVSRKDFLIHRLVGLHFVDNPKNKEQINHLDGDTMNNYYKNLEWCDESSNHIHATINELKNSKLNKNDVKNIRLQYENNDISYNKLSEEYDVSGSQIGRIIRRESWSWVD